MRKSNLKHKRFELTCLSPVHIGNGETLKAFEYLYDREAQEVYFLNEGMWISFLAENDLMDDFAGYLQDTAEDMQSGTPFCGMNLWEWLIDKGIEEDRIKKLGIRCAKAVTNTVESSKGTLNDIACHIALADGRPYIPGSTLKGALRTGLLYGLIMRQASGAYADEWRMLCDSRNEKELKKRKSIWNSAVKNIEKSLFEKLHFVDSQGKEKRVPNAAKDVLKGFSLSDAMPVDDKVDTVILQKIDVSTMSNSEGQAEKTLPLFRECIPAGTKFVFDMVMDLSLMGELKVSSPDEIVDMTRSYIQSGLKYQEDVFGKDYPDEIQRAQNADLILGGGTGFLTKSLAYAIAPSRSEGCEIVADYLEKAFPKHCHKEMDTKISPRTMKITRSEQGTDLMGLCTLREIAPC